MSEEMSIEERLLAESVRLANCDLEDLKSLNKAKMDLAKERVKSAEKKLKAYRALIAKANALAAPDSVDDEEPPLDTVAETLARR